MMHSVSTTKMTRSRALGGAYGTMPVHARGLSHQLTAVDQVAYVADAPGVAPPSAAAVLSIAPALASRWGEAEAPVSSASPTALRAFPFRQSHPFGIGIIRERILSFLREEARNRPMRLMQYREMTVDFTQPWIAACDRMETALIALNDAASDVRDDTPGCASAGTSRCAERRPAVLRRTIADALSILLPEPKATIRARLDQWAREDRLTVLLDVIEPLRSLFVDGRMTLVDVERAMHEFEFQVSELQADARRPGCRSRTLSRLPFREGGREPHRIDGEPLSAAHIAKASFEVYAEVMRRESRIDGTEFSGVAWGLMRAFRLSECFGHRLSIAWFDAFAHSNVLTGCRYTHVFGIAALGFADIARRGVFSYDWLETVSRGGDFFRLLLDSTHAMEWLSEASGWKFECDRYDYPRINPLTDALIHDRQISNERARYFLMAFRDFHLMQTMLLPDAGNFGKCARMLLSSTYPDRLIDTFARLTTNERMVLLARAQRLQLWLDTALRGDRATSMTTVGPQCVFL